MKNKCWLLVGAASLMATLLLVGLFTVGAVMAQGPMGGWGGDGQSGYGPGWMHGGFDGQSGYGPGAIMGYAQGYTGTTPYGPGWMHGGFNHQADGSYGCGGGMWGSNSPFFAAEPLSVVEATEAVESFLDNLNNGNLALAEIMIFDNHAYAEIVEKDTGIGAMELLIDPAGLTVTPEMGPNMMWNQKYGMMTGYGSGGDATPNDASAEMPVTSAAVIKAAQEYLDTNVGNNFTVDNHAAPFYGYYTLHVNQNDETVGMLSVNGYSGQVFLHTWHGKLLEMSEAEY